MAKKAKTTQQGGKGKKLCKPTDGQGCGNYIGARAKVCPNCEKPQLVKGKGKRKEKQQQEPSLPGQPKEEQIIALIRELGSPQRVKDVLGTLVKYDVKSLIGGVERAEKYLALLEDMKTKK
jgi:hypothetical protein